MKQRILLFIECNRRCPGCCNKDWDLDNLLKALSYAGFDEHMLTGGEPMLHPDHIVKMVTKIRKESNAPIYVYTAKSDDPEAMLYVLRFVDGLTLTLHARKDVATFVKLDAVLARAGIKGKSLRLNVFSSISLAGIDTSRWIVKSGIKWIKNCPLPVDEVFVRSIVPVES